MTRADAHRLPLAGASMDAAVTVATLEFTASPAQVLAEMARITRPGGRLVAVKVIRPELADEAGFRGRFARGGARLFGSAVIVPGFRFGVREHPAWGCGKNF